MANPTTLGLSPDGDVLPRAFGSYALLRLIAAGTRGQVFAALRPVEVERFCAFKILNDEVRARPDFVRAMRDEATAVVRRIHGNLVQIYDVGMLDDKLFFVSELVEGIDLGTLARRRRERGQPFPVDVAVFIAMEVAAALGALRRSSARLPAPDNVPSRLSPRSVLISTDGEVKLVHYGALMAAVGTAGELGANDPPAALAGAAGDVLLIGRLLASLVGPAAVPPPPVLARIVDRAVAANPADRLADAEEIRTALGSVLRGMRGGNAAAVQTAAAELVRAAAGPDDIPSRAALTALAKSFDPRRGAGPPTWKAITLTRLETGAGSRPMPAGPAADLVVGRVIPGTRYRVLSTIGEGGMGTVYAAEHVDLQKKVALKLLRGDVASNTETLQWFRHEARAASKIGSDYICDVTDFGELADGRVFFVMEYLDGQSLGRVLRENSEVPAARAIPILRQVCKALGAAHDKDIIHLDVKPDNVMLLARGKRADAVKVVDFGIAGLVHAQKDEEGVIAGTPEYISPERAMCRDYDLRSDIYSLGVMAYEMLSGAPPFHGRDLGTTLLMHIKDPPEPLARRAAAHGVPAELAALVMRMLDKDPAARPANMAEVEALLCEAQIAAGLTTDWDDLDLPAVDDDWREKLARRMPSARRPRRVIAVAASVIAAASLVTAGYLMFVRKPTIVVKEVRVELTKTEEVPEVAAALFKADQAARAERYVRPENDSALHHIQIAEAEATRLKRRSPGAAMLRRAYASALAVIGNELLKAELPELAVAKYKEALLFEPDDADLQKKAEIAPEEHKRREKRPGAAAATGPVDEAKDAATRIFLAATRGRLSEARLALAALTKVDAGGVQAARLADALRVRALMAWTADRKDEARPLYALVAELDPNDTQSRERAKEAAPPPPPPAAIAAAPAPAPPPALPPPPPKGKKHDDGAAADDPEAPRDPAASRTAAEAGTSAMARGRLAEAEVAFTKAVRADAQNAVAVGGLAEVAFERARYSDAMDFARRAARLAPKSPKYFVLAGDAYFKLLRYDDALRSYEKARALVPQDDEVKSRLERVLAKIGK
jgi:serine/threonine protein kinase/tetratricopeptide (TPR) repeat protein